MNRKSRLVGEGKGGIYEKKKEIELGKGGVNEKIEKLIERIKAMIRVKKRRKKRKGGRD